MLTTICCDAVGAAAYALEGSVFIAGAAVQWLRDELGIIGDAAETEALAQQAVAVAEAEQRARPRPLCARRTGGHRLSVTRHRGRDEP